MSRACCYSVSQWRKIAVYVLKHDYVNVRLYSLHNPHHTGDIENHKQHTDDLELMALFPSHLVLVQFFRLTNTRWVVVCTIRVRSLPFKDQISEDIVTKQLNF